MWGQVILRSLGDLRVNMSTSPSDMGAEATWGSLFSLPNSVALTGSHLVLLLSLGGWHGTYEFVSPTVPRGLALWFCDA